MQIADRTVATFHYTLRDPQGNVIDSSSGGQPLSYLHGSGHIVPGLERQMSGRSAGDRFDAVVPPAEGYGDVDPSLTHVVARTQFQGVDDIVVGMQFQTGPGAHAPTVTVTRVEGDQVTIDANHPLAGVTLHFDIEVTDVRAATDEELSHGHAHGPGGHHH